jgi:hypothetical protein
MANNLQTGILVNHETFGVGKVIQMDASEAHVYFRNPSQPDPDRRVRAFRVPNQFLTPLTQTSDPELDYLPPWKDGHFSRLRTSLSLDQAKKVFVRHFPLGLTDSRFFEQEVQYKRSAHLRYSTFRNRIDALIQHGDAIAIAEAIEFVYGNRKAAVGGPDERLNFLYQRIEEPAFFDALRTGGAATVEYANAVVEFVERNCEKTFERYLSALRSLPRRDGGIAIDSWTTATWLPFIAAPDNQFLVKPTLVQAFASVLPFDIQYRPDVNFNTYSRSIAMAIRLRDILQESEINSDRRPLDLIDVQSFMWVVERYAAGD